MDSIPNIEWSPFAVLTIPAPPHEHPWNAIDVAEGCSIPLGAGKLSSYPFLSQPEPDFHESFPPRVDDYLSTYSSQRLEHQFIHLHDGNSTYIPLWNHSTEPTEILDRQSVLSSREETRQRWRSGLDSPVAHLPSAPLKSTPMPRTYRMNQPHSGQPGRSSTNSLTSLGRITAAKPCLIPFISPNSAPLKRKPTCQPQVSLSMDVLEAEVFDLSTSEHRAKHSHNLSERKYRRNLTTKITRLKKTLECVHYCPPSTAPLLLPSTTSEIEDENATNPKIQSTTNNSGIGKGEVITNAIAYINQAEVEMRHMETEIRQLNKYVDSLQKQLASLT